MVNERDTVFLAIDRVAIAWIGLSLDGYDKLANCHLLLGAFVGADAILDQKVRQFFLLGAS